MAYLHCEVQDDLVRVVYVFEGFNPDAEPGIDFRTGDITLGTRYPSGEMYDFGTGSGTTLTVAAAGDDTVLTVADTTGMTTGAHAAILLDDGNYQWDEIVTVDSGTQITVFHGVHGNAAIGNQVVTTEQLDGDTSGTLEQNFKVAKRDEIQYKSVALSEAGVEYKEHDFGCAQDDIPNIGALKAFVADGDDLTGFTYYTLHGEPYIFSDNTDVRGLCTAVLLRLSAIYGASGGQADLIEQVTEADNTQAAMDAIVDSRT